MWIRWGRERECGMRIRGGGREGKGNEEKV
jgi:hypothetical protein